MRAPPTMPCQNNQSICEVPNPEGRSFFALLTSVCMLFVVLLGAAISNAIAQQPGGEPTDIVLALDNSGSMKHNDPQRIMPSAVSAFASRLPHESRLGVVVFDTTVRAVLPLTSVADSSFTKELRSAIGDIDYRGQWTDIPGAIERSLYELREHGRPNSRRVIVLFTDGFVDLGGVDRNRVRTQWLLSDLVNEAKRPDVGAMVFGIAFTDAADFALIQSLSAKTGGTHFRILSASDIPVVFDQVTDQIRQLRAEPDKRDSGSVPVVGTSFVPSRAALLYWSIAGIALIGGLFAGWVWRRCRLAPPIPATLQNCLDGSRVSIDKRVFRIGRVRHYGFRTNDLVVLDKERHVSRKQAQIRFRDGEFYLRHEAKLSHSYINGKEVHTNSLQRLEPGATICFDRFEYSFAAVQAAVSRGAHSKTEFAPDPIAVSSPQRRQPTVPPDGWVENRDGMCTPDTNITNEKCLACDKSVADTRMTSWRGYRICKDCEISAQSLATGEATDYAKTLETKRKRRSPTVEMA